MRWLLPLVCVGCVDDVGIDVRPPADVEVSKVELFLARADPSCTVDDGEPCPGIGPLRNDADVLRDVIPGDVFLVDHPEPFTADMIDGVARFRIQATSEVLPIVVAVGTGPDGAQNSVAVVKKLDLDLGARRILVDLEAAEPGLTRAPAPTGTRVLVWPDGSPERESADHACLGVELDGRRVFVVPDGDRDCDGLTSDDECTPLVHLGSEVSRPVEAEEATCTFRRVDLADVCRLGDVVCDETSPDARGCSNEVEICIGTKVCDACPTYDAECYEDAVATNANAISRITCNVLMKTDLNGGKTPCRPMVEERATIVGTCSGVSLGLLGSTEPFAPTITLDTGNGQTFSFSPDLVTAPGACQFGLLLQGQFPQTPTMTVPPTELVAKFEISPTREALLPVSIAFDPLPVGEECPALVVDRCVFSTSLDDSDRVDTCFGP